MADIKQIKINDVTYDIVATVPAANGNTLGTVKSGGDVDVSSGVISIKSHPLSECEILNADFNLTEQAPSSVYEVNTPYDTIKSGELAISADLVYELADDSIYDAEQTFSYNNMALDPINAGANCFIFRDVFAGKDNVNIVNLHVSGYDISTSTHLTDTNGDGWSDNNANYAVNLSAAYRHGTDFIVPMQQRNLEYTGWSVMLSVTWNEREIFTEHLSDSKISQALSYNFTGSSLTIQAQQSYINGLKSSGKTFLNITGTVALNQAIGSDFRVEEEGPYFNNIAFTNISPVYGKAINPSENGAYDLGSPDKKWKSIYVENIFGAEVGGKAVNYELKKDGTTIKLVGSDGTTTSVDGLMAEADKTKLNYTNVAYGTCATAAATAAKVITVTGNTNWALTAGSLITVLFSNTNTASNPTFNVNGTGAKNVYYTTSQITTDNLSYAGHKDRPMNFMYDGTKYVFIGWGVDSNSDTKVTQSAAITTSGEYPVMLGYSTATTSVTNTLNKASTLTYNPSTKTLTIGTDGVLKVNGVDIVSAINSKGTSNLTLGTTSTTAAKGDHTHSTYLSTSGGTLTSTGAFKWTAKSSKNPFMGYCTNSGDGTFVVGSLTGTTYQTGLAIGGSSDNLLWKGSKVATTSDIPTKTSQLTNDSNYLENGGNASFSELIVSGDFIVQDGANFELGAGVALTLDDVNVGDNLVNKVEVLTLNEGQFTDTYIDNEYGIGWQQTFGIYDENDNCLKNGTVIQTIPMVAGNNVSFEVDEQTNVVTINATGGGSSTTPTNVSLGQGYGTCSTAAATGAKASTITGYKLATGGIAVIKFTYAVPVNATLNITGTGAKPMWFGNSRIAANVIKAGDTVTFMFDGTYYRVISIDRWQTDIASLESRIAAIEEAVGCSL